MSENITLNRETISQAIRRSIQRISENQAGFQRLSDLRCSFNPECRSGFEIKHAEKRAEELLISYLTPEQESEYRNHRQIPVKSQLGNEYILYKERTYNIVVLDPITSYITGFLCGGPQDVPMGDYLLAQMLNLQNNEQEFVARCNLRNDFEGFSYNPRLRVQWRRSCPSSAIFGFDELPVEFRLGDWPCMERMPDNEV